MDASVATTANDVCRTGNRVQPASGRKQRLRMRVKPSVVKANG